MEPTRPLALDLALYGLCGLAGLALLLALILPGGRASEAWAGRLLRGRGRRWVAAIWDAETFGDFRRAAPPWRYSREHPAEAQRRLALRRRPSRAPAGS